MNNYYNIQSAIEQPRKPHTITKTRNSVFTYRDIIEYIARACYDMHIKNECSGENCIYCGRDYCIHQLYYACINNLYTGV